MKLATSIAFAGLLFGAVASTQAATTVQFGAVPANITPGTVFSVDILAAGFPEILGGGLMIAVGDPSVLKVNSAHFNSALWDPAFSNDGSVDAVGGKLSGLGFGTFAGASGNFEIATVSLTALAVGTSGLSLEHDTFNGGFTFSGNDVPITFSASTITVTAAPVPLPAPLSLFTSAIGALGVSFRKLRAS